MFNRYGVARTVNLNTSQQEFMRWMDIALQPSTTAMNELIKRIDQLEAETKAARLEQMVLGEVYLTLPEALELTKTKETVFRELLANTGYFKTDTGYYRRSEMLRAMAGIKRKE